MLEGARGLLKNFQPLLSSSSAVTFVVDQHEAVVATVAAAAAAATTTKVGEAFRRDQPSNRRPPD